MRGLDNWLHPPDPPDPPEECPICGESNYDEERDELLDDELATCGHIECQAHLVNQMIDSAAAEKLYLAELDDIERQLSALDATSPKAKPTAADDF